jgi:hypothetical protein
MTVIAKGSISPNNSHALSAGVSGTGETFHSFWAAGLCSGEYDRNNSLAALWIRSYSVCPDAHRLPEVSSYPVEVSFRKFQDLMQVKTCTNWAFYYGVQRRQEKGFPKETGSRVRLTERSCAAPWQQASAR